jgi:hypothetical protein
MSLWFVTFNKSSSAAKSTEISVEQVYSGRRLLYPFLQPPTRVDDAHHHAVSTGAFARHKQISLGNLRQLSRKATFVGCLSIFGHLIKPATHTVKMKDICTTTKPVMIWCHICLRLPDPIENSSFDFFLKIRNK